LEEHKLCRKTGESTKRPRGENYIQGKGQRKQIIDEQAIIAKRKMRLGEEEYVAKASQFDEVGWFESF
jgi:hypothetical protein